MNNKTKLSHTLETILEATEPQVEIESTPCWEWLHENFIKVAAKAENKKSCLFIEICFDENESPIDCRWFIKNNSEIEDSLEFPFNMSDAKKCKKIAIQNGISYNLTPQPYEGCRARIAFLYSAPVI